MTALKEGDLVVDIFSNNERIGVIIDISLNGVFAEVLWNDGSVAHYDTFFLDRLEVPEALKK